MQTLEQIKELLVKNGLGEVAEELDALIEKKVREAMVGELANIQRYNEVIGDLYEILTFPGVIYIGKRLKDLEEQLQDNQAKEGV